MVQAIMAESSLKLPEWSINFLRAMAPAAMRVPPRVRGDFLAA
ncbi:MAG: hypothetical protein ACYCY8_12865 [Burkholderiales bacterium]